MVVSRRSTAPAPPAAIGCHTLLRPALGCWLLSPAAEPPRAQSAIPPPTTPARRATAASLPPVCAAAALQCV